MDESIHLLFQRFAFGLKALWKTEGQSDEKPRLSHTIPAVGCLSLHDSLEWLPTFFRRAHTLCPLAHAYPPTLHSAVRQGVRLQHPPHVWQGGQADGLHPLQLHERDPVQPAQPGRLPRWVDQPPSPHNHVRSVQSGIGHLKNGELHEFFFMADGWIGRFPSDSHFTRLCCNFFFLFFFFSLQDVRFDTATRSCWSRSCRSTKWLPVESARWVATPSASARLPVSRFWATSHKPAVCQQHWWRKKGLGQSGHTSSAGFSSGWQWGASKQWKSQWQVFYRD